MKKQVQEQGVRKWFGDDFIGMQDEIYKAIEKGILDGGTGIVSGVKRTQNGSDYTFSPGIVMMDGVLHSFAGHTSNNGTIYLVPLITNDTRAYLVGGDKNITTNNNTDVVYTQPASGSYIKCDDSTKNRYFILKTDNNNSFSQEFKDIVNNFVAQKYGLQTPTAWTNIPGAKYDTPHTLGQPKYMIDALGYYHFRGFWNGDLPIPSVGLPPVTFLNLSVSSGENIAVRVYELLSDGTIRPRQLSSGVNSIMINPINGTNYFELDLSTIPPIR